ncbi:WxL domain-containing protein [Vagococcus sp. PNs007]|uniref:WxL domain-containing protein n=1 Tax=Vagococcus proximus TaxID=2991417 RepID=A0ABT5WZL1_9ENTE|nr:WxL domain-containing protein [Vagococcus proximus]MDF0479195.1 WxL domain-containing protein [Vagococcus proximus]
MKKIQFLAVATLVSTILGGVAVSAAEPGKGPQDLDTTTHVKFVQDDNGGEGGGTVEPPKGPEGGGEVIVPSPGGNQPSEKAPLMINFAPNFEFGEVKIQSKTIAVPAENQITDVDGKDVAHFAEVLDNRGTHEGWNLTVTTTDFKSAEGEDATTLDDASISLTNVTAKGESEGKANVESNQTINFPQTDVTVMTAEAKAGEGSWAANFGSAATLIEKEDKIVNPDVKLNISAKDMAKVSAVDYTATLTWNLTGNSVYAVAATPAV